jgi:hypothetical protein
MMDNILTKAMGMIDKETIKMIQSEFDKKMRKKDKEEEEDNV